MKKQIHYPVKIKSYYSKNKAICGLAGVKVSSNIKDVDCKKCKQELAKRG